MIAVRYSATASGANVAMQQILGKPVNVLNFSKFQTIRQGF
jgi:hypothetical protein